MDFGLSTIASLSTSMRVRIATSVVTGVLALASAIGSFGSDAVKGTAEAAGSAALSAKAGVEAQLATTGADLAKAGADAQAGLQASVQQSADLVASIKPSVPSITLPPPRTDVKVDARTGGTTTVTTGHSHSSPPPGSGAGGQISGHGDITGQLDLNGAVNGVINGVMDTVTKAGAGVDLEAQADLDANASINGHADTQNCMQILWFQFC
jgi:hypothetical protein